MQSAACTHARQRFLPPSSPSSFPKLNQMGFSISFSTMLPPCCQLCLSCCRLCVSRTTGRKGFPAVTRTVTELPPATISGTKTLQTQWQGRAVLPCWAAWIPGAHNSAGREINYFFCQEETGSGHYYFFGRKSSDISAPGSSRGTRLSRKGRGRDQRQSHNSYLLKAKQPGSFGEEILQGPAPLQDG